MKVVAISGPAGAQRAMRTLFEALRADCPFAVVVIRHSSTNQESHLDALLRQSPPMPVRMAKDGDRLEAGQGYGNPPGVHLTLAYGVAACAHVGLTPGFRRGDGFMHFLAASTGAFV